MKEYPIIFKTDMVRAILDDRKTMTRRICKGALNIESTCKGIYFDEETERWYWQLMDKPSSVDICIGKCPYGQVSDRLWVRETHHFDCEIRESGNKCPCSVDICPSISYKSIPFPAGVVGDFKWRPSIHMPRWASSIILENRNIRVERVQEISLQDKWDEGYPPEIGDYEVLWDSLHEKPKPIKHKGVITHYVSYPWEKIRETRVYRGKPWYVYGNTGVWVIEFKKI